MIYDILVLGGGASGLFFGSFVDKKLNIAMVEANSSLAKKLKVSGGGKCNFTNRFVSSNNFDSSEFVEYFLDSFSNDDLLEFLDANGLEYELREGRFYFCKKTSSDLMDILKKHSSHADLLLNHQVLDLKKDGEAFKVFTQKGVLKAKKVVVALGAKSFASLGATDMAQHIAKSFGLKTREFSPALVGLTLQKEQFWMRELSGLSIKVSIKVGKGSDLKELSGDLLFTHKGISGPAVLSASLYWQKGGISIDFVPHLGSVDLRSKKHLSTALALPKRLTKALFADLGIVDRECHKISDEEIAKLRSYTLSPAGNFGFSKAEVCRGGVLTSELDAYTLEAKNVSGLYFIGEAVDVAGELGGYNLQWAFSSAYVCAKSMI